MPDESSNAHPRPGRPWHLAALLILLAAHFSLQLNNLGHSSIKPLDEVYHATVARHFLKHPLTPTLFDRPFIETDDRDWQRGHIWLHKPPMAMWQIALSYLILGVNALALRLPSALLATAALGLTYLIGRELLDRTAGLVAAALQAANHAIMMLVHGYVFSDHVDIALLFWVELAMYLLARAVRSGAWWYAVLAGVAQGIAFLSKTYPALIVSGVALVAWGLPVLRLTDGRLRLRGRQLLALIAATLLTIAPWTIYCLVRWPELFIWENAGILRHLHRDVEGWAGPWDRLVFDYLVRVFHWFYALVFVGAWVLIWRAWRGRDAGLWLVLAWAIGGIVPHALATSKTPTATLIAWPALWLVVGAIASLAIKRDRLALVLWAAGVVVPLIFRSEVPARGWGYPDPPAFAGVLRENIWVAWQILSVAALAGVLYAVIRRELIRKAALCVAVAGSVIIAGATAHLSLRVTRQNLTDDHIIEIASIASQIPADAVFLIDEQQKLEHMLLMFWSDRTCYPIGSQSWGEVARRVIDNGGVPYLVSPHHYDLPLIYSAQHSHRRIYACTPLARELAAEALSQREGGADGGAARPQRD